MKRGFSLVEILFVLLIISSLYFLFSKVFLTKDDIAFAKLKTEVGLINSAILNKRAISNLDGNSFFLSYLDTAALFKENEKLFNLILDKAIISSNKIGHWIKVGKNEYKFNYNPPIYFEFNGTTFNCIKPIDICEKLR